MTAIRKLWNLTWARIDAATRIGGAYGIAHGIAPRDVAALRLYSLPRGVRQRSRDGFLDF